LTNFRKIVDIPVPLAQEVRTKLVSFSSYGIGKILFVCEHQKHNITKLILSP
jgi:hypothetical protein